MNGSSERRVRGQDPDFLKDKRRKGVKVRLKFVGNAQAQLSGAHQLQKYLCGLEADRFPLGHEQFGLNLIIGDGGGMIDEGGEFAVCAERHLP